MIVSTATRLVVVGLLLCCVALLTSPSADAQVISTPTPRTTPTPPTPTPTAPSTVPPLRLHVSDLLVQLEAVRWDYTPDGGEDGFRVDVTIRGATRHYTLPPSARRFDYEPGFAPGGCGPDGGNADVSVFAFRGSETGEPQRGSTNYLCAPATAKPNVTLPNTGLGAAPAMTAYGLFFAILGVMALGSSATIYGAGALWRNRRRSTSDEC